MSGVNNITELFVELALKCSDWNGTARLSDEEVQVFLQTVQRAGFEATSVVEGKLLGNHLDEDRRCTGQTFVVNEKCPYKVMGADNKSDCRATEWLNNLFVRVRGKALNKYSREQIVESVQIEIERSVPLKPIQLTTENDFLLEYSPQSGGAFPEHTRDGNKLSACVGTHACCYSWVDRKRTSKTHDVLVCRGCFLRIVFPTEIQTYGGLRAYMEQKFQQKE
ncbi:MAG: hypothetical protein AAB575_00735 [Patescibacteria group bacterium]